MNDGLPTMTPLAGGASGETWLSEVAGERTVVRIYGGRSLARGPAAPEIDAEVLRWVRDLVPAPEVLEVRHGDPASDRPGLLVTTLLPGVRLDEVLPGLADDASARVGASLGTVLARLAHVALPREGCFVDPRLVVEPFPAADVAAYVDERADELGWSDAGLAALSGVASDADAVLSTVRRVCLVHGDLDAANLLVDPVTLEVTGVLDWELARAGSPYADLGSLLRHDRAPADVEAVLAAREALVPDPRHDALDLARAADLVALVDLACRRRESPVAARAARLLEAVVATGDRHAVAAPSGGWTG